MDNYAVIPLQLAHFFAVVMPGLTTPPEYGYLNARVHFWYGQLPDMVTSAQCGSDAARFPVFSLR